MFYSETHTQSHSQKYSILKHTHTLEVSDEDYDDGDKDDEVMSILLFIVNTLRRTLQVINN